MSQPSVELILPKLWRAPHAAADQARFINSPARISIAATGTKTGKTVGCAAWLIRFAGNKPRSRCWWIAPSHYQANIGFERVIEMVPASRVKVNHTTKTITFSNGSVIEFKTGEKPNLLFGQAVHACVVDEASRMKQDAWKAILTTMTQTMGPIRVASNTDQGKSNWFYPLYLKGYDATYSGRIQSYSIKSYENPYLKAETFLDLRDTLDEVSYMALVEAEFPENALNVFRGVERCVFHSEGHLPIIVPPHYGGSYVMGVDVAKKRDYTVMTIIDVDTQEIVYWNRFTSVLWETQFELIREVSAQYNDALVLVDSTGPGEPFYERLLLNGIPVEPYVFNNASKQLVIRKLAFGIEHQEVRIPDILTVLLNELKAYEYDISKTGTVRFQAPNQPGHADAVISLALAFWAASNPFAVGYESAEKRSRESLKPERRWDKRDRGF